MSAPVKVTIPVPSHRFCDQAAYFLSINRNKKSITLDMKSERGKEVLWRLVDSETALDTYNAPPRIGEHTHEVLTKLLGYSRQDVLMFGTRRSDLALMMPTADCAGMSAPGTKQTCRGCAAAVRA